MKPIVVLSCVYNDWISAGRLFPELGRRLAEDGWTARLVLVDDGSYERRPDGFLAEPPPGFAAVEVVTLRRNLGHQRAIAVGLCHLFETLPGHAVLVMDSDGEDRPGDAARLLAALRDGGDGGIVFAERTIRSESALFQAFYHLYRLMHLALTGYGIRFGNFSVIPAPLLGRLVTEPNMWVHYAASVVAGRMPHRTIPSERGYRIHGQSKLGFIGLVVHGLAAISCFSEVVGVRLLLCSAVAGAVLAVPLLGVAALRIFTTTPIPGWASYSAGLLVVLLMQVASIAGSFVFLSISGRKAQTFLPLEHYRFFLSGVDRLA